MYGLISFLLRISTYPVGIQGGLLQFVSHWDQNPMLSAIGSLGNSTSWKLSLTAKVEIYSARLEGGGIQSTVNTNFCYPSCRPCTLGRPRSERQLQYDPLIPAFLMRRIANVVYVDCLAYNRVASRTIPTQRGRLTSPQPPMIRHGHQSSRRRKPRRVCLDCMVVFE